MSKGLFYSEIKSKGRLKLGFRRPFKSSLSQFELFFQAFDQLVVQIQSLGQTAQEHDFLARQVRADQSGRQISFGCQSLVAADRSRNLLDRGRLRILSLQPCRHFRIVAAFTLNGRTFRIVNQAV